MHTKQKSVFKYLLFLAMFFVVVNTAADIVVYKMIKIGPFLMSVGVFLVPLSYACSDLITEVYGYKISRQVIWYGLLAEFLFDCIGYLASSVRSPALINNDLAYQHILHPLIFIYLAVFVASVLSDFINIYCISKWKVLLSGKYFWLRSIGASFIAEFVFTLICDSAVFFQAMPGEKVIQTIFSTFAVKMLCAIVLSIPLAAAASILKKVEEIDVYDQGINFNPFLRDETSARLI